MECRGKHAKWWMPGWGGTRQISIKSKIKLSFYDKLSYNEQRAYRCRVRQPRLLFHQLLSTATSRLIEGGLVELSRQSETGVVHLMGEEVFRFGLAIKRQEGIATG